MTSELRNKSNYKIDLHVSDRTGGFRHAYFLIHHTVVEEIGTSARPATKGDIKLLFRRNKAKQL